MSKTDRSVNSALVSRSQIFEFQPLSIEDIESVLRRALEDAERGLGAHRVDMRPEALRHLAVVSDGDARRALTALEVGVLTAEPDAEGVASYLSKHT